MPDVRQILLFMGFNMITATVFTGMFMNIVGVCISLGAAVILSQASVCDFS